MKMWLAEPAGAEAPAPKSGLYRQGLFVDLFACIEVSCYLCYAGGGRRLAAAMSRPAGFAVMLALS